MKRMKQAAKRAKKLTAGMLCMAMVLFAGCGTGTEPQEEPEQQLQKVTVGEVAHSIFYAPGYAAMSLGYFEEEGLEVDLINLQGADKVMSALISDEIQVGLMGPEEPYQLRKQKNSGKLLLDRLDGYF